MRSRRPGAGLCGSAGARLLQRTANELLSLRPSQRSMIVVSSPPALGTPPFRIIADEQRAGFHNELTVMSMEEWKRFVKGAAGGAGGLTDENLAAQLSKLGFAGRSATMMFKSKPYLVLGGMLGARRFLRRGNYKPPKPTIVDAVMASIPMGQLRLPAARLCIALVDCAEILDTLLADRRLLESVYSNLGSDLTPGARLKLVELVKDVPYGSRSEIKAFSAQGPIVMAAAVSFEWNENHKAEPLVDVIHKHIANLFVQARFHISMLEREILFRIWPHVEAPFPYDR